MTTQNTDPKQKADRIDIFDKFVIRAVLVVSPVVVLVALINSEGNNTSPSTETTKQPTTTTQTTKQPTPTAQQPTSTAQPSATPQPKQENNSTRGSIIAESDNTDTLTDQLVIVDSEETFDIWLDIARAKDQEAMGNLMLQGRLRVLNPGTDVRVSDWGFTRDKIRVTGETEEW